MELDDIKDMTYDDLMALHKEDLENIVRYLTFLDRMRWQKGELIGYNQWRLPSSECKCGCRRFRIWTYWTHDEFRRDYPSVGYDYKRDVAIGQPHFDPCLSHPNAGRKNAPVEDLPEEWQPKTIYLPYLMKETYHGDE